MPYHNDYHAFKSTSGGNGGNGGSGGNGIGCAAWIVIAIVVFMLIFFIANGASWEAIECLLAFGLSIATKILSHQLGCTWKKIFADEDALYLLECEDITA